MVALPKVSRELAELVRQQARDDERGHRARPHHRETLEADLARREGGDVGNLDFMADPKAVEPSAEASKREWFRANREGKRLVEGERRPVFMVGLDATWTEDVVRFDPSRGPCPLCGGRPPRRSACACCHASDENPHPRPMQAKDARRRPGDDWDGTPDPTTWSMETHALLGGLARLHERPSGAAGKSPRKAAATARPKAPPRTATMPRQARRGGKVALRVLRPFGSHRPGEIIKVRPSIGAAYVETGACVLADQPGTVGG